MKKTIYLLVFIILLGIVGAFGCGKSVTVTFIHDGETVTTLSVAEGEKIGELPEIEQTDSEFIIEWNIDENEPITEDVSISTIKYTKGLDFNLYTAKDQQMYEVFKYDGSSTVVTMPDYYKGKTVGRVARSAFFANDKITTVFFPKNLLAIGEKAFYKCYNLRVADIPETVTTISAHAFMQCKLTECVLPSGLTEISNYSFNGNPFRFVKIPDKVTVLDFHCFAGTILKQIVLPKSLEKINYGALWTGLEKIYYAGTSFDWENVQISDEPNDPTSNRYVKDVINNATIYYYSESTPETAGNYWRYVGENIYEW